MSLSLVHGEVHRVHGDCTSISRNKGLERRLPQRFVQKTSGSPHEVLRLELLGTMLFLLQRRGEAWCGWRKQVAFRSSANSRAWARNDDDEEPDGGHGLGGPGLADPAEDGGWRMEDGG
jgi:hypothetical protein